MALVLVADDDAVLREMVCAVAELAGHVVLEAADGAAAWASVQAHRPDVVLLDMRRPGRSGLAVTQAVKSDPVLAGTRMVMYSGSAGDAVAALGAGANAHLLNSLSLAELQAALAA